LQYDRRALKVYIRICPKAVRKIPYTREGGTRKAEGNKRKAKG